MSAFAYPDYPMGDVHRPELWAAHYVRGVLQLEALHRVLFVNPCEGPLRDALCVGVSALADRAEKSLDSAVRFGALLLCWVPDGAGQGAA